MKKKYIVRLSVEEKTTYEEVLKKLKGSPQKVMRAQILLKADRKCNKNSAIRNKKGWFCHDSTLFKV